MLGVMVLVANAYQIAQLLPAPEQVMKAAIERAPVGLLLLDKHFLKKACPFAELRTIMELNRALPVLYATTYKELELMLTDLELTAASQQDDSDMLQSLRRNTMLQTSDLVSTSSDSLDGTCS